MELIGLQEFADICDDSEVVERRQHGAMDIVEMIHRNRGAITVVVGGDGAVVVPKVAA
jgi:hypothetical protein